jgi:hypothetical protein
MKEWTKNYMQTIGEIEAKYKMLKPAEREYVAFLKWQIKNEIAVSRHQAVSLDEILKRVCK